MYFSVRKSFISRSLSRKAFTCSIVSGQENAARFSFCSNKQWPLEIALFLYVLAWSLQDGERHVPNAPDRAEKQSMDESRRRLEELKAGITEEEMEKYRRERTNKNDPMAKMLGKDELIDA